MGRSKSRGNIPAGMIGAGSATIICLTGLAILTQLILMGKIGERGINTALPILLAMAATLGGQISYTSCKKAFPASTISGGVFLMLIVIMSLIMDGGFSGVVPNISGVVVGTMISFALCWKKTSKPRRKKKPYR